MNIKDTHCSSFVSKIYRIARELIIYRPLTKYYYFRMLSLRDKKSGLCLAMETRFFGEFNDEMISLNQRKRFDSSLLDNPAKYPFEKYEFFGFADYDKYLTTEYGQDYMTPKNFNQHIENYSDVTIESK